MRCRLGFGRRQEDCERHRKRTRPGQHNERQMPAGLELGQLAALVRCRRRAQWRPVLSERASRERVLIIVISPQASGRAPPPRRSFVRPLVELGAQNVTFTPNTFSHCPEATERGRAANKKHSDTKRRQTNFVVFLFSRVATLSNGLCLPRALLTHNNKWPKCPIGGVERTPPPREFSRLLMATKRTHTPVVSAARSSPDSKRNWLTLNNCKDCDCLAGGRLLMVR